MSSSEFSIAFEGKVFDNGEIAVNDLAPALLALGEVVQAANKVVNGDRTEARLTMRATDHGSFSVLLNLDVSMAGAVLDMLDAVVDSPDRVVAANQLLELILNGGKIGGTMAVGLFFAIKFMRGKKPDKVSSNDNGTTTITVNRTYITVDNRTISLLEDLPTRQAVEDFANKSLGVQGVETFRIGRKGAEDELQLNSNDRDSFRVPEQSDEDVLEIEKERIVFLKIVTSSFRGDYKWRFTDGGEKPFTASMEDAVFLNKIDTNQIAFSKNDTLKCRLLETQRLGAGGLTKEITVIEVMEHIVGAKQLRLL